MNDEKNNGGPVNKHGGKDNLNIQGEAPRDDKNDGFVFGRLFPTDSRMPVNLKLATCDRLGKHMASLTEQSRKESKIPAGYTYFGQFVDHDISLDVTEERGQETPNSADGTAGVTPDLNLVLERSPSLDLDSLYGSLQGARADFMDINGAQFKIGKTTVIQGGTASTVTGSIPYDLPRNPIPEKIKVDGVERTRTALTAMIGDGRNDENLAVAQIHLMWLKFHNHVVDKLREANPGAAPETILSEARNLVTCQYQFIVLHDFVKRIVPDSVFKKVVTDGKREFFDICCGENAFMPLEFSVAAYRYGHSQVREEYDWNLNFGTNGAIAGGEFQQLFAFSGVSGNFSPNRDGNPTPRLGGLSTLPTNWLPDFRRLFDFDGKKLPDLDGSQTGAVNMAKAIDPYIAPTLGDLPALRLMAAMGKVPFNNLASLNLLRGVKRSLPSGQAIANAMGIAKLNNNEIKKVLDSEFFDTLDELGLLERTPLWLYMLIESAAKSKKDDIRLGPVAGTIVAETFVTLALTSRTSILRTDPEWTPKNMQKALGTKMPLDTIADILTWMDSIDPIIDPLQDQRMIAQIL